MRKLYDYIIKYFPFILAGVGTFVLYFCKITAEVEGLESVLESVITFSSIIIGFYTAMYGVLISLKDSDIFKAFDEFDLKSLFTFQLYESVIISFLVLSVSIIMQISIHYENKLSFIIFYIWLFTTLSFFISTIRTVNLLLKILLHHNHDAKLFKASEELTKDQFEKIEQLKKRQ
ncbi:hypothetical protein [Aerococcus urinaeequi]|uniref:hypothetical protein n=1 Tax=Aerococcus urinaeequi TaxID=51665 RepID=UPI0022E1308E|nr:hypothetical protein [Aerococcus urinaeequi]